jgi:cytochrome c-type biogenesis protein CcmH
VSVRAAKPFVAVLALLALVLAPPVLASEQHPSQSQLEAELVCPTCHSPLDESTSPIAQQMKAYIRTHIAAGWTATQIKDGLVAQLGPGVLGVPGTHGFDLLAWLIPFAGIAAGASALAAGAWIWSRNRDESGKVVPLAEGPALTPGLERRVDDELARFDR